MKQEHTNAPALGQQVSPAWPKDVEASLACLFEDKHGAPPPLLMGGQAPKLLRCASPADAVCVKVVLHLHTKCHKCKEHSVPRERCTDGSAAVKPLKGPIGRPKDARANAAAYSCVHRNEGMLWTITRTLVELVRLHLFGVVGKVAVRGSRTGRRN